jgi:Ulp1 family protease
VAKSAVMDMVLPKVPTQANSCDCGVFLLEYAEQVAVAG